ncbi:ABC transporter substrate-binding protein [Desulfobacter curvatus]|uniref:ABC transporter substrate-binding protein n=1 Tax=Desulfobacter curvatus TaxID=2290 RepID=UPI0003A09423|nr:ABC transporter substrate binding protein [Desulfobacter curvatus]
MISKKIKPYIQIGDGIKSKSEEVELDVDIFFLDPETESISGNALHELTLEKYKLIAAIGPEAAVFIWSARSIQSPKIYTAILDPENCSGLPEHAMGIALKIPVEIQVEQISRHLRNLDSIGILFNPKFNQVFYNQADAAALNHSFEILPIKVDSKNQIFQQVKMHISKVDAIWMIPDQTIISEKIIQYVIKQGIYQNTGVIGYNSFFSLSGAVFSFEFDYEALGRQAALKIKAFIESGQWVAEPPVFKTIVNQRIAKKIGISVK